jgi:hypothetical protein
MFLASRQWLHLDNKGSVRHVDEARVVALEGDGDVAGGPVAVPPGAGPIVMQRVEGLRRLVLPLASAFHAAAERR